MLRFLNPEFLWLPALLPPLVCCDRSTGTPVTNLLRNPFRDHRLGDLTLDDCATDLASIWMLLLTWAAQKPGR
jgi:hypothetical protein